MAKDIELLRHHDLQLRINLVVETEFIVGDRTHVHCVRRDHPIRAESSYKRYSVGSLIDNNDVSTRHHQSRMPCGDVSLKFASFLHPL